MSNILGNFSYAGLNYDSVNGRIKFGTFDMDAGYFLLGSSVLFFVSILMIKRSR